MQVKLVPKTFSGGYHLTCFGGNNGSIQTVVTDGQAPYTYVWSTGVTTETLEHAMAGTYSVTVTDAQGSTATATIDLLQPKLLEVEATSKLLAGGTHISKAGGNDGAASSDLRGGTPPYTYLWNTTDGTTAINGSTKDGVYNLEAGTYTVTVEDVNGCSVSASVTLTEPTPLTASLSATTYGGGYHVSCAKAEDGAIDLSVSGGIAPYKFDWSSGHFTEDPTGLKAGYHEVRITDANGAKFVIGETLTEPDALAAVTSSPLFGNGYNVSCHSCYNGTVNATVNGGVAPYTYDWQGASGSVGQTADLSNAGEAEYGLRVTDANGCLVSQEVKLKIPERDDWRMGGNTNVQQGQFLGTTDATDVEFRANNQPQLRLGADGTTSILQQLNLSGLQQLVPDVEADEPMVLVVQADGSVAAAAPPPSGFLHDWQEDKAQGCWSVLGSTTEVTGSWSYGLNKIYSCPSVNVGLGTDEPIAKLDVRSGSIMVGYAPAYSAPFADAQLDVKGRVVISSQQNIGPTFTNAALDVRASSNEAAFTIETLDKDGLSSFRVRNNGKVIVGAGNFDEGEDASLYFGREDLYISGTQQFGLSLNVGNHASAMIVDGATGKVGIGVGDSHVFGEGLLEVNGTIRSQKVVAEVNGWPDYVFDETYELMPLSDLRMFIATKEHLPGIPSAEEMESEGMDLVETSKMQMEKIEQLTLYILDLEARIKALEVDE